MNINQKPEARTAMHGVQILLAFTLTAYAFAAQGQQEQFRMASLTVKADSLRFRERLNNFVCPKINLRKSLFDTTSVIGFNRPLPIAPELPNIESLAAQKPKDPGVANGFAKVQSGKMMFERTKQRTGGIRQEIQKLKQKELEQMKSLPNEAEHAAANLGEVKDLEKQTGRLQGTQNVLEQYRDMLKNFNPLQETKPMENLARQEMPGVVVENEAKLRTGIAQLEKLVKKYRTVADSRYFSRHVPNAMNGKPFRERLVPGMGLEIFRGGKLAVDFAPYLLYRVSGKLRIGPGVFYKTLISGGPLTVREGKVYGVRILADLMVMGSLFAQAEGEWQHVDPSVQHLYRFPAEPQLRIWNTRLNVGMKRIYTISHRFRGTTQLSYNTLDWSHFPARRNVALRFGVEYGFGAKNPLRH